MYKKLIVGWILLAILAWAGPAGASGTVKRIGLTIFSALEVGQSARAVGMGSAFTPVGDDINAIWWNPAGLSNLDRVEVSFSHSQWFVNSTFNSGAIGIRKGIHAFGVSLLSFMPEEVEERTTLQPGGTGRILSLGTTAIAGAYAIRFTDKLSFGVRIGWAREDLDLTNHTTFNVDFGTRFYTGFRSFRLSMSMRNFGKDTEVLRREFQQPLTFNIGGAAEIVGIKGDPFYVTAAYELSFAINYEERHHFGGEAWLANMLALRAGYMANYDGTDFTAGAGLKIPFGKRNMTADFAWQQSKNDLNTPLRFTIGFKL